jgi:predicted adenine nucleotide alpha hydrolase (AANH) superfamily ATPase
LGTIRPKGHNRIVVTIGYGHVCLREDNLNFINNYFETVMYYYNPNVYFQVIKEKDLSQKKKDSR